MLPALPPVLTCAEAKAWESGLLQDESAEWAAMQRAGRAIADAVQTDYREIGGLPAGARLLVLVGKGHNGGDALLAAQALLGACPQAVADVLLCFSESALRPLARRSLDALRTAHGARVRCDAADLLRIEQQSYALCLDGVFGFQFRPPMDAATAALLAAVNAHARIALRAAVDLPSGLGEGANAATVFRADFTYGTGIVKAPVVAPAHAAYVGRVRYLDLGFFDQVQSPARERVLTAALLAPLAALRPAQTDKRTYGHLVVVGGSRHYPGAVLMTVQAALRSGVGLLTACVPASLVPEYAARFPEAMWVGFPEGAEGGLTEDGVPLILEKLTRATALVIGPGLGAAVETIAAVAAIVHHANTPLVLDADALRPEIMAAAVGRRVIATPHAGEAQRIAAETTWQRDGVIVLKGSPTRVVAGGTTYYSFFGGPVLARGGSGDVLAGLISGLLAQAPADLPLAAARGVVWHGLAADLLARDKGQIAVQTTQLFDYLQPALLTEVQAAS